MIDIHCHILPGVDDGAATMDDALDMARLLRSFGFTSVVATPHIPGYNLSPLASATVRQVFEETAQVFAAHTELNLIMGGEHCLDPLLLELDGLLSPLGARTGGALLVEFPWQPLGDPHEIMFALQMQGHPLVLAHPERSPSIDLERLEHWVSAGQVFVQLTLGSLAGFNGARAQARAEYLLAQHLVHFVATDLHGTGYTTDRLDVALTAIERRYGAAMLRLLLQDNPRALLDGDFHLIRSS